MMKKTILLTPVQIRDLVETYRLEKRSRKSAAENLNPFTYSNSKSKSA